MEKYLTIHQVSERTGLSVHTLRYYEKIGLIHSVKRSSNQYRLYDIDNLLWIEFLMRLKQTGMPIHQMIQFAYLRSLGSSTVNDRRKLLEEHYHSVVKQVEELQNSMKVIQDKINYYKDLEEKNHE